MDLIDRLEEMQGDKTDSYMAEKIGCSRQMYNYIVNRKMRPGRDTLAGILKAFPETLNDIGEWLVK